MRIHGVAAAILMLATVLAAGPVIASDDGQVKERRVVKIITTDGPEVEEGAEVVVMGDDGEPLRVRSFFLHKGGYLGVQLVDLTKELRRHFGVPEEAGVMVSAVSDQGPAAAAGLEVGDVITAIDGDEVGSARELAQLVRAGKDGDAVNLEVWRSGTMMMLGATLGEREKPQIDVGSFVWQHHGKELEDLDLDLDLDGLPADVIHLSREHIHQALGDLSHHLESPEWKDRLRSMVEKRRGMEERIRELEGRLQELEQRLSNLDR